MKLIKFIFLILIFIIINNRVNGQIVKGPKTFIPQLIDNLFIKSQNLKLNLTDNSAITNYSSIAYARYDWSFLRLHIHNNNTQFHGYINFHPRVDEFTTIKIPNSNFLIQDEAYTIWVELPGSKNITSFISIKKNETLPCFYNSTTTPGEIEKSNNTECLNATLSSNSTYIGEVIVNSNITTTYPIILPPKHIFKNESQTFVNYFTLIVQLDNGVIVDAMWDGDRDPKICNSCDDCIDNQCSVKLNDMLCNKDTNGVTIAPIVNATSATTGNGTTTPEPTYNLGVGCQLKMFVSWVGVDRNKKSCQSINKIPSKFQKYSSTSLRKIGTGLISDFLYRVNDQNNPNQA